jgi:hypothetical protein
MKVFHEFDSNSAAMVVLEGDRPLGDEAHRFYDTLIHKLSQDTKHVEHIQAFWGDPLTAAGSQSADGKAAGCITSRPHQLRFARGRPTLAGSTNFYGSMRRCLPSGCPATHFALG